MYKNAGFTLIELMITVAIIGIISAIAYPSYIDFVTKGARADAHTALMRIANMQEQYYLDNRTYADTLAKLNSKLTTATENGHYNITLSGSSGFTATATAKGSQATRDKNCTTITINELGEKGPKKECW